MSDRARPGTTLRTVRRNRNWTLAEVARRTGIPISTLSKIETGQISPTYDQLTRLSDGLQLDIAEIFTAPGPAAVSQSGRRSINRRTDGQVIDTPNQSLVYLNTDLLKKSFTPIIADIKTRRLEDFGDYMHHPGEEFLYVIEGELELHTELYAPVVLAAGESIYFDSSMGHAYIARGASPCRTLSICTVPHHHNPQAQSAAAHSGDKRMPESSTRGSQPRKPDATKSKRRKTAV